VWWFDWKNIGSGSYEIMAKAWDVTGKDWVSRKVNVHKN
jgi:hypothetical protein